MENECCFKEPCVIGKILSGLSEIASTDLPKWSSAEKEEGFMNKLLEVYWPLVTFWTFIVTTIVFIACLMGALFYIAIEDLFFELPSCYVLENPLLTLKYMTGFMGICAAVFAVFAIIYVVNSLINIYIVCPRERRKINLELNKP